LARRGTHSKSPTLPHHFRRSLLAESMSKCHSHRSASFQDAGRSVMLATFAASTVCDVKLSPHVPHARRIMSPAFELVYRLRRLRGGTGVTGQRGAMNHVVANRKAPTRRIHC
jgi:hypothetical protein